MTRFLTFAALRVYAYLAGGERVDERMAGNLVRLIDKIGTDRIAGTCS